MGLFGRRSAGGPPAADGPPGADDDERADGWDAVDAALRALHGDVEPVHVAFGTPVLLGGEDLHGASAYARADHWHCVSYGLSDLFDVQRDDPVRDEHGTAWSGWGFELTLRVPRAGEAAPPTWALLALDRVAVHVERHAAPLEPGDRVDLRAPVTGHPSVEGAPPTGLTVWAVAEDPELGTVETANGRLAFLQLVGVTAQEKAEMLASSTRQVLDRLAAADPLLVTDPSRA